MKLHVGCGNVHLEGFINIDLRQTQSVDVLGHAGDLRKIGNEQAELLFSHAVFEHIYLGQHLGVLREWKRVLKTEGTIVCLGLPDFGVIAQLYVSEAPGVIGSRFDLFNVYRYTHGQPEHATPAIWNTFRPELRPDSAPSGWLPQLHKSLFDARYVQELMRETELHAVVFNYAYPGEKALLNLGFVAQKTESNLTRSPEFVKSILKQVPEIDRFADMNALQLIEPSTRTEELLNYARQLDQGRSSVPSFIKRVARRLRLRQRRT